MKKLGQDIEILTMPLLIMLGVLLLFAIGGKVVYDNITSLTQKGDDNSKVEATLQTKLNSLQVAAPSASNDSQLVLAALPASSSVFSEIYQLKQTAISFGLLLNSIESAQAPLLAANPVVSTEVDFEADGTYQNIASFIQKIRTSAPISRFDNIRIANQNSVGNNIFRLTATLFTYWSPLPTKLPSIDDPITELTADEKATVAGALTLSQPNVIPVATGNSQTGSTSSGARADPFSP